MQDTFERFPTRCLPMMIANQSGWFILNDESVLVTWNGGSSASDLKVEFPERRVTSAGGPESHFGSGILTWRLPLLFRTPPNFNLWVRGPTNMPKVGAHPLEGIVETDWAVATFTMNWQMLIPGKTVAFDRGEPCCMIIPMRKHDLEQFSPVTRPISANRELAYLYQQWARERALFMSEREVGDWQKDYVRGRSLDQAFAREHATRVAVSQFKEEETQRTHASKRDLSRRLTEKPAK